MSDFFRDIFGCCLADFSCVGAEKPSSLSVMRVFFFHHFDLKKTVQESARTTARLLIAFWVADNKPTIYEDNVLVRIRKLHKQYLDLQKRRSRGGPTFAKMLDAYRETLSETLDIGTGVKSSTSPLPPPTKAQKRLADRLAGGRSAGVSTKKLCMDNEPGWCPFSAKRT
jgi:hypothetical protein